MLPRKNKERAACDGLTGAAFWLRVSQYCFLVIGITALAYCGVIWYEATIYQDRATRSFESELRKTTPPPAAETRPKPKFIRNGGLVGRLEIPRIGISVMVVEGVQTGNLRKAAGHIPGTAMPWETGNVAIAAHRDTFFRPLAWIRPDDTVNLQTSEGTFLYRVTSTQIVDPKDVAVLQPTDQNTLTLVTCFPFFYIGSAPKRFIVQATRTDGS